MDEKLEPRCVVQNNAQLIKELRRRVHDTCKLRDTSPHARAEWSRACDDFHQKYDALTFPGGYEAGLEKIRAGEPKAIAYGLAFLEVRPYFFRSQYMRTKFLRLLKHARLSARQAQRLETVLESEKERKDSKGRRCDPIYEALELRLQRGDPAQ